MYVIHRDVDFEFGHVVDVCSSPEKAQQCLEKALQERDPSTGELVYRAEELSIEEWTLDGYLIAPSPT